jgi:hypothetical protein
METSQRQTQERGPGTGLYGSSVGTNMAAAGAAELIGTAVLVFAGTGVATAATLAPSPTGGSTWSVRSSVASWPRPGFHEDQDR